MCSLGLVGSMLWCRGLRHGAPLLHWGGWAGDYSSPPPPKKCGQLPVSVLAEAPGQCLVSCLSFVLRRGDQLAWPHCPEPSEPFPGSLITRTNEPGSGQQPTCRGSKARLYPELEAKEQLDHTQWNQ